MLEVRFQWVEHLACHFPPLGYCTNREISGCPVGSQSELQSITSLNARHLIQDLVVHLCLFVGPSVSSSCRSSHDLSRNPGAEQYMTDA